MKPGMIELEVEVDEEALLARFHKDGLIGPDEYPTREELGALISRHLDRIIEAGRDDPPRAREGRPWAKVCADYRV